MLEPVITTSSITPVCSGAVTGFVDEGACAAASVAAPAEEVRLPGVIDVLNREDIIEAVLDERR